MKMPDDSLALANHPFLQGLAPELVSAIEGCATEARFSAGQTVFREGEGATTCYLIWTGKVSIEVFRLTPGPVTLQTLSAGDALGWSWLAPPYRWRFDARAIDQTLATALDAAQLRALCDARPDLGYALALRIVQVMEQRLQAVRRQILEGQGVD